MIGWQQHAMIQCRHNFRQTVPERDEVNHIVVLVQFAMDRRGNAIIVSVETFTHVTVKCDEMGGAENQVWLGQTNLILFRHWPSLQFNSGLAALKNNSIEFAI
jgi:hypothetical protein